MSSTYLRSYNSRRACGSKIEDWKQLVGTRFRLVDAEPRRPIQRVDPGRALTSSQSMFPHTSVGLRKFVYAISPELVLRVVQIEHASPGLADFAGIGKAMEEFNKLVFGIWDRLREKDARKVQLEKERLALAESKREAAWKAETRDLHLERQRHRNRKIAVEADLKEVTLFRQLYNFATRVDNPDELNRLIKLLSAREKTLGQLVVAGKITQVEQIESG